jgi:DNA-binding transcriptional LysR family regulator
VRPGWEGLLIETVTLDHLRVFLAIVDRGSFTAAARDLGRSQSAISHAVAQLEAHLAVRLFERNGGRPAVTEAGRAVGVDARAVIGRMQALRARASWLSHGLEAEVSIAVSVMMPTARLTAALGSFRAEFPSVALRLYSEALGGVVARVIEGACRIGVNLAAGRLVLVRRSLGGGGVSYSVPLLAIHRRDDPPGPAVRALLDRLIPKESSSQKDGGLNSDPAG